jgi:hypothetical protein
MHHTRFSLWTVAFFGPLKSAYAQECDAFIVNHANQPVKLRNVAGLFKIAYLKVATINTAENSIRACGMYPSIITDSTAVHEPWPSSEASSR